MTDPVAVEWYRYMTANARAHDYMGRQSGCWPCRRCERVFRHPLPRSRHEHSCSGVTGDALLSFPLGACVVPDDPKALPPPAPAP